MCDLSLLQWVKVTKTHLLIALRELDDPPFPFPLPHTTSELPPYSDLGLPRISNSASAVRQEKHKLDKHLPAPI